jgi:hypothetical protein
MLQAARCWYHRYSRNIAKEIEAKLGYSQEYCIPWWSRTPVTLMTALSGQTAEEQKQVRLPNGSKADIQIAELVSKGLSVSDATKQHLLSMGSLVFRWLLVVTMLMVTQLLVVLLR